MALFSHLFQEYRWRSAIIICIYLLSLSSIDSVIVSVEQPSFEDTNANIWFKGTERFDSLEEKLYPKYETDFATRFWKGTYYQMSVADADWYGGAEGKGFYAFSKTDIPYRLVINKTAQTEKYVLDYFGLWASALKKEDQIDFFYKGKRIFGIRLELIYNKIHGKGAYWRNRHSSFLTKTHAFVYVNFFFDDGEYDEVRFSSQVKWFCSDNHSVGLYKSNTKVGVVVHEEKLPNGKPKGPKAEPVEAARGSTTPIKMGLIPIISTGLLLLLF